MSLAVKFSIPYGKQTISQDDIDALSEVISAPLITTGPKAKAFEKALCNYTPDDIKEELDKNDIRVRFT